MSHFLNYNNNSHASLQFNASIENILLKICDPLFSNFNLTYFEYAHFLNDGTYLNFSTHLQWHQHYIEHFGSSTFVKTYVHQIYDNQTKYALWDNRPNIGREKVFSQFISDSCAYNIWHGFSIYEKHEASLEAYHFATSSENYEAINFYINRLDLLYHFILYFKDKADKLIDISDSSKLIALHDKSPLNRPEKYVLKEQKIKDFVLQTAAKKFSLNLTHGAILISKREAECVLHLSANKTIKEIARSMDISPRTVESYLDNVKKKSNCSNKAELVNLFEKNSLQYL
jgi:DNA-binding CsgD family transcriptional regulator